MPAEKYTAIYNDLKEKIEEGLYAPQSILPSENILTARYGVSRNTISSIETGQFNPTAKLALVLCIALDKKFEEIFYF